VSVVPGGVFLLLLDFARSGYDWRPPGGVAPPLPNDIVLGKRWGKRLARGCLSTGKEAQMVPVLASITDHIVAGMMPHVGSLLLAPAASVVVRKTVVAHTL
jgi:hypothetical protein